MPDAKELSAEDTIYWRAAALQDLADVLHVQRLLALESGEPSAKLRLLARLAAEPEGAGLGASEQLAAAKRRAIGALQVLRAPEPRTAQEAATLAATAWTRCGVAKGMQWSLALKPHELFEVSPFQVQLATDPGPWFEPRNIQDLDAGQLASVRRCGVWSPIHVRIVEEPAGLLVIAGSRRTRMVRVVIREGLEALVLGRDPVRPRPLLALVPSGEVEADIFLADNMLREGETPWTIAERFVQQIEGGAKLRAKDIAARTGLSQRLVSYYLALTQLPASLRAEGAAGRLGVKLASWLAQVPDPGVQLRLFEVTLPLKSEAARMEAARILLEQHGGDLADGRELVLPVAGPPVRKGSVFFSPKLRTSLATAAAKAKGAAKKQVSIVADWCAAWDGDSAAAARLPPELREALPAVTDEPGEPSQTQRRRHPSQSRERREAKFIQWEGFTGGEQQRYEAVGLGRWSAEDMRTLGIPPEVLRATVQLNAAAPWRSIATLYMDGTIHETQLKKLVLDNLGPLSMVCPGCCMDRDHECQPDPYVDPGTGEPDEVISFEGAKVHEERRDEILRLRERLGVAQPVETPDPKVWPMFSPDMQAAWEAAGIGCSDDALEFEARDFEPATVAQVVQIGDERLTLGAAYTLGKLTMVQVVARLRQLPLIPVDDVDPREVVCPVCAADVGSACDDGGHPHKIRGQLASKARELRPVAMGVA